MSDILKNFRQKYPVYDDISDAELSDGLYKKYYSEMPRDQFDDLLGNPRIRQSKDGVSFLDTIKAGIENLGGAGVAAKAGIMDLLGNEEAAEQAIGQYHKNQTKVQKLLQGATDWRDIVDADSIGQGFSRTLDYVKEQFGLNSPQMAVILAGGAGGAALAPTVPVPNVLAISKAAGFTIGATMAALPMFTGFNVGRQIDEGKDINLPKAASLAVPQALTEAFLGRVLSTSGLGSVTSKALGEVSETALGKVGGKIGEALAVGIPSEVIQQAMERTAADLEINPLESEEALQEYIDTAIASAAAMAPMGAISSAPTMVRKKGHSKAEIEAMLKEDVELAPEPTQNIIRTPEEASKALSSLEINPEIFTDEGKIKAANLAIERVDNNRMKFYESLVPDNTTLKQFMLQQSPQPKTPIKTAVNQGVPLGNNVLETYAGTPQGMQELSEVIKPKTTETASLDLLRTIDEDASTEELMTLDSLDTQRDLKATQRPESGFMTPSRDVLGVAMQDLDQFKPELRKLAPLKKAELVDKAIVDYQIPEAALKTRTGKYKTKPEILGEVFKKMDATREPFTPTTPQETPSKPLKKISEASFNDLVNKATPLKPSPEAVSTVKPIAKEIRKVSRKHGAEINVETDLKIDAETKNFTKPIRAAQAANYMYTSSVYSDTVRNPEIDTHLQESWEYFYDKLPQKDKDRISKHNDKMLEVVDASGLSRSTSNPHLYVREALSSAFVDYASSDRQGKVSNLKKDIPQDVYVYYNKLIRSMKDSAASAKNAGINTFEDVFPQISAEGLTAKDVVFNSIESLRMNRLKNLSKALRKEHWKTLEPEAIQKDIQQAISQQAARKPTLRNGLYGRSMFSSLTHMSTKNPVAALAFNLVRTKETDQSNFLTDFADAGLEWFSEPSKEVRTKAAAVIDTLRRTDQTLEKDNEGAIVFRRGDEIVRIQDPKMIQVIDSLSDWGDTILETADAEVRASLAKYFEGSMTQSPETLLKSLVQMEKDGSIDDDTNAFIRDQLNVMKDIRSLKGKPFIPYMRFGEYGLTVHSKDSYNAEGKLKPNSEPVLHVQIEKGRYKGQYNRDSYNKAMAQVKKYQGDSSFKVSPIFEMTYNNITNRISPDAVNLEMLSGLLGSDKTEQFFVDVKDQVDRQVRFRGFRKRFAESRNIEGYSTDWDRVINSYHMGAAHFFAKARYAPEMQNLKLKLSTELNQSVHKSIVDQTTKYLDYMESPHDSWQNIRTLNFLWTMGMNVSTAALQVMTLPTTSLGSMTQYDPNIFRNSKRLGDYFNIALKTIERDSEAIRNEDGTFIFRFDSPQFLNKLKKKHGFSDDELNFIVNLYRDNRTGATLLEESVGKKKYDTTTTIGKIKDRTNRVAHKSGSLISGMEQATRFATAMAHYKMFKESPAAVERAQKILANDARFQTQRKLSNKTLIEDLAYFGLDEAHAVFGKMGRAEILRGGAGTFLFPFMTYPQNAVEFMTRMAGRGKEGKQALVATTGLLFTFSGLMGLPGGELLKELLEEAYKITNGEEIDLDQMVREKLNEATGDPRAGLFVTQGLFRSHLNMDVSRRIGLPIIGQDLLLAALGVRGDMSELAGVQGSMATQMFEAVRAYNSDESGLKIGTHLTPTSVSNILKAIDFDRQGVKTTKGRQLKTPEQVTAADVIMRAVGVTTGSIANKRDAEYWSQLEDNRIRPKMDSFRSRGKNILTKAVREQRKGNDEKYQELLGEYRELTKEVAEFLKKKKWAYNMGAFHKSVSDAVDQRLSGEVRYKDYNKATRHRKNVVDELTRF